jgi:hypothetical protein
MGFGPRNLGPDHWCTLFYLFVIGPGPHSLLLVDNHACILLRIKNTLRIQRKVATVLRPLWAWNRGQLVVHRTDSEQEVQNRRLSLFPDTLQLPSTTPPTTPLYNSSLLLCSTEKKIHLPSQLLLPLLLLPPLQRSSPSSELRNSRGIILKIVNTVQEYQPSSAPSSSYHNQ